MTAKLAIATGSYDDNLPGEAHFLEHLLYGGSHRGGLHPKIVELSEACGMQNAGADTGGTLTRYYAKCWSRHATELFRALLKVAYEPEISHEAVEKEIGVIKSEISRSQVRRDHAMRILQATVPSHPELHHSPAGYIETVEQMSADRLMTAHRTRYTAHRSILVVTGSVPLLEIAERIWPCVERLPQGSRNDRIRKTINEPDEFGSKTVKHLGIQSLGMYVIGQGTETGTPRLLENIKNMFFSSFEHGILYRELRHKRSLVYNIEMGFAGWPATYSVLAIDGITEKNFDEVHAKIFSIMDATDLKTFEPKRLAWIKNDFLMHEMIEFEDRVNSMMLINLWEQDRLESDDPRASMQAVLDLTPEKLLEMHHAKWNTERALIIRSEPA